MLETRNLAGTENEDTGDPAGGGERLGIHSRDEGKRTSSHTPYSPHLLGQRAASEEKKKKKDNHIVKLKGMREGAKVRAGAGAPSFAGGRTWVPEPLGLREEGPDLEKQGAGDKDSWAEDGEAGGPELPSSLTIFLEQRNMSGKGLLLLLQHPEQLLHEELTWEEAG